MNLNNDYFERMRFFFFFFLILQISFAQVSKVTSYTIGGNFGTPSSKSHTYTDNHSKYITTLQDMPTGAFSVGTGVTKLNECDEVEWSNIYVKHANPYYKADITLETGTTNVYVTGIYSVASINYLSVLKLDEYGNVIFSKFYDFGSDIISNYYTNYSTSTGGLVVSAKYAPLGGGSSYTCLIHLDNTGNVLNASKHFDTYSGISSAKISDDIYIHRSSSHIYQVRTNGQVDWAMKYGTAFQYSNFFNMIKQNDGYVMVVSRSSDHFLAKIDFSGNLLWVTDVKTLSPYPPVIVKNKNNQILMCTYISNNGTNVPLLITFDSDGHNLNEEIITDLDVDVSTFPSISKSPYGNINLAYPSGTTTSVVYLQNVEASLCKEPISIPEVENVLDVSYASTAAQSYPLILDAVYNIDITLWDLYTSDSVRCNPITEVDSIFSTAVIDCNSNYVHSGDSTYSYYWPHDGSTNAEKILDSVGVYLVEIENCFSKITKTITVTSICGCTLNIPNAFTPNNDQLNDVFEIYDNCGIQSFEIYIYDRWGKRIFHSKDLQKRWDGTYNDSPVKSDVYYYKIQYTPLSVNDITQTKTTEGLVTVLY